MAGDRYIMAKKTNMHKIAALVNALPLEQLRQVKELATTRFDKMPFRFMDLPKEMRLMIYELLITPDMAKAHAKGRTPSLFHVNGEIRNEFIDFYYSRSMFKAEFYDPETLSWNEVRHPRTIQAMFEARWRGCYVKSLTVPREFAETFAWKRAFDNPGIKTGVLGWVGAKAWEERLCSYWDIPALIESYYIPPESDFVEDSSDDEGGSKDEQRRKDFEARKKALVKELCN